MLIVQLTDTHITAKHEKVCGVAPTAENLLRGVEHINRLQPQADVVLVTGDICNKANLEEAKQAAEILSGLNCPYFIVPGNHDNRDILWESFDRQACPAGADGFINYVIEDYEMRLIGLDSLDEGKPNGKFSKQSARWLAERLAEDTEKPTMIFMHHPPIKCGVLETDREKFKGGKRLGNIIEGYNNIERILCGHIHAQAHIKWRGTIVTTAPSSTGMKIVPDLTLTNPSQFYIDSPNFLLHYWSPDKKLISYQMDVNELEGPFMFAA